MSWKIIENYRRLLLAERGTTTKNWGGKLTVCLVYPNRYRTGMSNLGFQAVYALLNAYSDVVCERAFLPSGEELNEYRKSRTPLLSLESQRPVSEFDIVAFSVSFEADYLAIPRIFSLSGIPPFSRERTEAHPLVMAGGAALFLNPEPVADLIDIVSVGEAEAILPPLMELFRQEENVGRQDLITAAAALPGIYVPKGYAAVYEGNRVVSVNNLEGFQGSVPRVFERDIGREVTASRVITPETEFGEMYLVEISRGCPRGCRFCAAGFIYHPYRQCSLEKLKDAVDKGLSQGLKIGLVGAAISDYREVGALCRHIVEHGGKFSVSSLRIDGLNDEMIGFLKASGHKTVALAPEGGSQRLRDLIRKGIDEEQILAACEKLIGHDILNLKLYFIIGLPTETGEDLEELVRLVGLIRERVAEAAKKNKRLGEVLLSVNPFIPKPFTPFQWCGMEEIKSLERKGQFLQNAVRKLSNVRLHMESPKEAYLQALLSRGDRRLAALLVEAEELGSWKKAASQMRIDTDSMVCRAIPLDGMLPWQPLTADEQDRLRTEYRRAFAGRGN